MTARDTLTAHERRVIVAPAGGQSAQEIADQLHVSPHTVQNQRRSGYEKLGARSLIEAMHRLGWVQVD